MLFNSLHFALFFPVVTTLYFLLPHRHRLWMLLLASCYFYMALVPKYILILFFLIAVDYTAGLLIERAPPEKRRLYLLCSLLANVLVLSIFKYFNFINANVGGVIEALGGRWSLPNLNIILPIGLSFHTFQSISYVIEVYRGRQKAERNLGKYALYVLFYPQLVAGPIERPQNLLHQFDEPHRFDYARVTDGLKLMVWGLFKKVVIADRLAVAVDLVYNNPTSYSGWPLVVATYFFAIQIYCDFSGYTDMARGAAQVMGFRMMENFRAPYLATSIGEFWRRWHISLSSWFRDYVYIPMGGNQVPRWRWYANLMAVFLLSGLWHGASWTFVIWGGLHGLYLIVSAATARVRAAFSDGLMLDRIPRVRHAMQIFITFNLVTFAWIFFRARTVAEAKYIVTHLFSFGPEPVLGLLNPAAWLLDQQNLLIAIFAVACLEIARYTWRAPRTWLRWATYYVITYSVLLLGKFEDHQFIYFQF